MQKRAAKEGAFTIVELLIVVVVIAILAAITIMAYNGVSKQAHESTLKEGLRSASTKVALFNASNDEYPTSLLDVGVSSTDTDAYVFEYIPNGKDKYCLSAIANRPGISSFHITNSGALASGECDFSVTNEACFGFSAQRQTIDSYWDNQNQDVAQPACPRAVNIPRTIGGVEVKNLGDGTFSGPFNGKNITFVRIPDSVVRLGSFAFASNPRLALVDLPNSVTTLDYGAFIGSGLQSIKVPQSLSVIGGLAFQGTRLNEITIPRQVVDIQSGAFSYIPTLKRVVIDSESLLIGHTAFQVSGIESVVFSGAVRTVTINQAAFVSNKISELIIPNSIVSMRIGSSSPVQAAAFSNNKLTNITIPQGVTEIGPAAFQGNQISSASVSSGTNLHPAAFDTGVTVTRY